MFRPVPTEDDKRGINRIIDLLALPLVETLCPVGLVCQNNDHHLNAIELFNYFLISEKGLFLF